MMIRAVYHDGKIEPVDDLPAGWQEGQSLEVRAVCVRDAAADTDDWINARGAFANDSGAMPHHVREELARRLTELHALGPMEFEPGEREEMEQVWRAMDELGREEMKRIMGITP